MEIRVLVTGFEPFGGETINPALEVIEALSGRALDGHDSVRIFTAKIPTVFGQAIDVLEKEMEKISPSVVICIGQAGGRCHITPERVAINIDDARIPDNGGNAPVDVPVVTGGPVAYLSDLPIKRMVQAMQEAGIPATVSNSAGTFVCNHLFYGLMHLLKTKYKRIRGGFVHIPYLPSQVVQRELPAMNLSDMVHGLEICVRVAVEHALDVPLTAGKEC
ncbi:pyroglutamyl-peptidase I [Ferroacidibacillus organovorans]|uniref:Pyrrolidone-carboxylate peptidase n=1 Tax=Ferroacidibacillus organovorans TaxID=1765683 RepID=A0A1V4ER58_9BACL|nr:pyroglutamyl-peptidase I [Ferroacidibacillus organovorans]OPG15128.1 pyroglutamyl-peptidase I [Ferroacidibacillus organovorans]